MPPSKMAFRISNASANTPLARFHYRAIALRRDRCLSTLRHRDRACHDALSSRPRVSRISIFVTLSHHLQPQSSSATATQSNHLLRAYKFTPFRSPKRPIEHFHIFDASTLQIIPFVTVLALTLAMPRVLVNRVSTVRAPIRIVRRNIFTAELLQFWWNLSTTWFISFGY